MIDLVLMMLFGCDRVMWEKWNCFRLNYSKASDVTEECHNSPPHTVGKVNENYCLDYHKQIFVLLTQLISFGPIAGDAFSVSDE